MMATLSAPSSPISKSLQVSRSAASKATRAIAATTISGQVRRVTKPIRREMRRRAAIEPVIGHLKEDHRMRRNYLTGRHGDRINAVLAAAGYNFSLLLRWFKELLCVLSSILWHALLTARFT
jgi:Transposase DDE domain